MQRMLSLAVEATSKATGKMASATGWASSRGENGSTAENGRRDSRAVTASDKPWFPTLNMKARGPTASKMVMVQRPTETEVNNG